MANRKILHKRTSGNTPTPNMLSYGEIALNYGANKEALYLRSSTDKIVEIKTDDYNEKMFLMEDNKVFTTFETKEAYNAAVASGEIVAPNTSYIVDKNQFLSLSRIYQYNMKMVITQEWLNYWDEKMTSQGVDHIYLCEFFDSDWIKQTINATENTKIEGLCSDCITSFVVNDEECRHKFVTIPQNVDLNSSVDAPNGSARVGYAIPRNQIAIGDTYDIHIEIVCDQFDIINTVLGVLGFFSLYNITPMYSFTLTEQLQNLVQNKGQNIGIRLPEVILNDIKFSGDFGITIDMFTNKDGFNVTTYLPMVHDHYNGFENLTSSYGVYNEILDKQAEIGIQNPSLTVYLPNNNPTYGSPNDLWDGSTENGKTMWGVHNYYLANKWNQSDFQYGVVDGPNLVAWKSNYTFNVIGYNDETYNG